eukprot:scaffold2844_cov31-Tisochrysis_lutea.AAC.5
MPLGRFVSSTLVYFMRRRHKVPRTSSGGSHQRRTFSGLQRPHQGQHDTCDWRLPLGAHSSSEAVSCGLSGGGPSTSAFSFWPLGPPRERECWSQERTVDSGCVS